MMRDDQSVYAIMIVSRPDMAALAAQAGAGNITASNAFEAGFATIEAIEDGRMPMLCCYWCNVGLADVNAVGALVVAVPYDAPMRGFHHHSMSAPLCEACAAQDWSDQYERLTRQVKVALRATPIQVHPVVGHA